MAQVNPLTRELLVKLVYYGPGLCGKTTSLQCIHQASPPETRGQIVSLATPVDRTLYFDFLPLRTQNLRGHGVRLQLFTVPGQVYFNATRKLVLTGADGVVFVADSQRGRHDANLESLENLANNLEEQGRSLPEIPMVMQFNKRDLPGVMDTDEMSLSLNALGVPEVPTSASSGEGVLDALDQLVQLVLEDLERRNALGEAPKDNPEPRFGRAEDALEEQIGRASEEIWRSTVDQARSRLDVGSAPADPIEDEEAVDPGPPSSSDARRPTRPPQADEGLDGPTWIALFPDDAQRVRDIERLLRLRQHGEAIRLCHDVAVDLLLNVAQQAGLGEHAREPALVLPLLGVDGPRWLGFQRILRRARTAGPLTDRDGLEAYQMLLEIRMRRDRLLG